MKHHIITVHSLHIPSTAYPTEIPDEFYDDFIIRCERLKHRMIKQLQTHPDHQMGRRELQRNISATGPLFNYVLTINSIFECSNKMVKLCLPEKELP